MAVALPASDPSARAAAIEERLTSFCPLHPTGDSACAGCWRRTAHSERARADEALRHRRTVEGVRDRFKLQRNALLLALDALDAELGAAHEAAHYPADPDGPAICDPLHRAIARVGRAAADIARLTRAAAALEPTVGIFEATP